MAGLIRSFLQSLMKMFNAIIGMAGIAMVIYSFWMIRVWDKQTGHSPFEESDYPFPWFIYSFLGLGVTFCVITCSVLEGVITADVFLNHNWEQDFPKDPTGNLHQLKVFIRENFDFCKWIALPILAAQGLSFLLAMVLKALGPQRDRYYDSDEEYAASRHPLLRNSADPPHVPDSLYAPRK